MTKVVIVGSSLKNGPAVAGSAGPIPAPLRYSTLPVSFNMSKNLVLVLALVENFL